MPEEAEDLYGLPLEEFTAARDALAKRLRDAGEVQAAAAVRKLRKPSLAAWVLNQTARRYPEAIEELLAVTDRVRLAQRKVMSGGKPSLLREAASERRGAVAYVAGLAGEVLAEAGHPFSAVTSARVTDSLQAVASNEEGAEMLRAGTLVQPIEPGPMVEATGLSIVEDASESEAAAPERVEEVRAAVAEAKARAEAAREEAERATAEADRLGREAAEAERHATALAESAEFALRAAEARRREAEEADRALVAAEEALRGLNG